MSKLSRVIFSLFILTIIISCKEKEEEFLKTTEPEVSISNFQGGETVHSLITLDIEVNDTEGVEKVEVYLNGILKETLLREPYRLEINTFDFEDGPLQIKAIAYDAFGNKGVVEITLFIDNILVTFKTLDLQKISNFTDFSRFYTYYIVISGEKDGVETIIFEKELDSFEELAIRRPDWYHEDYYNYVYAIRTKFESNTLPDAPDILNITSYEKVTAKTYLLSSPTLGENEVIENIEKGKVTFTFNEELQSQINRRPRVWSNNSNRFDDNFVGMKYYISHPIYEENTELFVNLELRDQIFREYISNHSVGDTIELSLENTSLLDNQNVSIGTADSWISVIQYRSEIENNNYKIKGIIKLYDIWEEDFTDIVPFPMSKNNDYNYLLILLVEEGVVFRSDIFSKTIPSRVDRLSPEYQFRQIENGNIELELTGEYTYAFLSLNGGTFDKPINVRHIVDKNDGRSYLIKKPLFSEKLSQIADEFGYDQIKPREINTIFDTRISKYSDTSLPIQINGEYKIVQMRRIISPPQNSQANSLASQFEKQFENFLYKN